MLILLRRRDGKALAQLMLDHSKNTKTIVSAAYSVPEQSKRTAQRRVPLHNDFYGISTLALETHE